MIICNRLTVLIVVFSLPVLLGESVSGQVPVASQSFSYTSTIPGDAGQPNTFVWRATKQNDYDILRVQLRMDELSDAALLYANNHANQFPSLASELFDPAYITDPLTFHNPGDTDVPPITIDNDMLNGPNSSRISFDYFGAGHAPFDPGLVLFQDNTPSNNFGLGRMTAYADGHERFVAQSPHTFETIDFELRPDSPSVIYRPDTGTLPYTMDLPAGTRCESTVAPHRIATNIESEVTQDVHAVFTTEGYNGIDRFVLGASTRLVFSSIRVDGPDGMTSLTFYLPFAGTFSRESGELNDSVNWSVLLTTSLEDFSQADNSAQVFWTALGLVSFGVPTFLEHRVLAPSDEGYVPGHDSIFLRGIASMTIDAPANETGSFVLWVTNSASTTVQEGVLGAHKASAWVTEIPATPTLEQIIVFAPPGYEVIIEDGEPNDIIRTTIRGDHNLDGFVENADRDAFIAAYSHPLPGSQYLEPLIGQLEAFDFDGDADVDCADWTLFAANWSPDEIPPSIPPCANDSDADGVPDGDDDCAMTISSIAVDDRGCPRGDFDGDADIDLVDWTFYIECTPVMNMFPLPPPPYLLGHCWNAFDVNDDKQVGLIDMAAWQNRFTGSAP